MENPNPLARWAARGGFKAIRAEARRMVEEQGAARCLRAAQEFYGSKYPQPRQLAVFLMGFLAADEPEALAFLRETAGESGDWRVREALAPAFADCCAAMGGPRAGETARDWLGDGRAAVRRAAARALPGRVPPDEAADLLGALRGDPDAAVRREAAAALAGLAESGRR